MMLTKFEFKKKMWMKDFIRRRQGTRLTVTFGLCFLSRHFTSPKRLCFGGFKFFLPASFVDALRFRLAAAFALAILGGKTVRFGGL